MSKRAAPLLASLVLLAACYTHEHYLIESSSLTEALKQSQGERDRTLLPARRKESGKAVKLRLATLDPLGLQSLPPSREGYTEVSSHTLNKLVTAGSALTWVGSAISIAGTLAFALLGANLHDQNALAGASTALAAEPIMLTGTILWILGQTTYRPEEAP